MRRTTSPSPLTEWHSAVPIPVARRTRPPTITPVELPPAWGLMTGQRASFCWVPRMMRRRLARTSIAACILLAGASSLLIWRPMSIGQESVTCKFDYNIIQNGTSLPFSVQIEIKHWGIFGITVASECKNQFSSMPSEATLTRLGEMVPSGGLPDALKIDMADAGINEETIEWVVSRPLSAAKLHIHGGSIVWLLGFFTWTLLLLFRLVCSQAQERSIHQSKMQ